jgi:hypothetical protein
MFVAHTTGFQALRNILPLIACRDSLVNNTSTANSDLLIAAGSARSRNRLPAQYPTEHDPPFAVM